MLDKYSIPIIPLKTSENLTKIYEQDQGLWVKISRNKLLQRIVKITPP